MKKKKKMQDSRRVYFCQPGRADMMLALQPLDI